MNKLDITSATQGLTDEEIKESVTMATKRLFGTILDSALWGYASLGFRLEGVGVNILELYFKDKKIATYNRNTVLVETIHRDCKRFISQTVNDIQYPDHRKEKG